MKTFFKHFSNFILTWFKRSFGPRSWETFLSPKQGSKRRTGRLRSFSSRREAKEGRSQLWRHTRRKPWARLVRRKSWAWLVRPRPYMALVRRKQWRVFRQLWRRRCREQWELINTFIADSLFNFLYFLRNQLNKTFTC